MAISQSAEKLPDDNNVSYMKDYKKTARVIAVTSGKGGVGKTNIATNLSIALAQTGKKVCVIDADLGLANINILLGTYPENTLEDLFNGTKTIEEVAFEGPAGIQVIPGATGLGKISDLTVEKQARIVSALEKLEASYDYIFIDTSAGISSDVLTFVESANEAIVIVSPEPTSLTDAYSLIKVLKGRGYDKNIYAVVNMVLSYDDSMKIFSRLNGAAKKYLDIDLKYLGFVMMDQVMVASVIQQTPVLVMKPDSNPSRCFTTIASKFDSVFNSYGTDKFSDYWRENSTLGEATPVNDAPDPSVKGSQEAISEEVLPETKNENKGDLPEQVIATPAEVREQYTTKQPLRVDLGSLSEEKAKALIQKLETAFVDKFNKQPYDLKEVLYSSLELSDFSEERIREMALVLESIYEKRCKKHLFDLRDVFIRLLEDSSASEEKMKTLFQVIEKSFQRLFKKPLVDINEKLSKNVMQEDFSEKSFAGLITSLHGMYKERFGKALKTAVDFPDSRFESLVTEMDQADSEINDILGRITELKKTREVLKNEMTGIVQDFLKEE